MSDHERMEWPPRGSAAWVEQRGRMEDGRQKFIRAYNNAKTVLDPAAYLPGTEGALEWDALTLAAREPGVEPFTTFVREQIPQGLPHEQFSVAAVRIMAPLIAGDADSSQDK